LARKCLRDPGEIFAQEPAEEILSGGRIGIARLDISGTLASAGQMRPDRRERVFIKPGRSVHGRERPRDRREVIAEPIKLVGKAEAKNGNESIARQQTSEDALIFPRRQEVSQQVACQKYKAIDDEAA